MPRPFTTQLTARQRAVLEWVRAFIPKHGMPPTVREIGAAFGYRSSSVFGFLKVLERKGYIKRGRGARQLSLSERAPALCQACEKVRIAGRIAAGQPIYATEDNLGTVTVSKAMGRKGSMYALRVTGDSMVDAGILDGDWVIIREQDAADDGDIVVALVGDEATLKYLRREKDRIRLQPANSAMKPIYVKPQDLRIQGKVVGVQRFFDQSVARRTR
jgi:repressor LexA